MSPVQDFGSPDPFVAPIIPDLSTLSITPNLSAVGTDLLTVIGNALISVHAAVPDPGELDMFPRREASRDVSGDHALHVSLPERRNPTKPTHSAARKLRLSKSR
jgi:hypothetical protein